MDELGHSLSSFDAAGTRYPSYAPEGAWRGTTFETPAALGQAMAGDPEVRRCVAEQWVALLGARRDECVDAATDAFVRGGDWAALLADLVSTRGFLAP